MQFKQYLGTRPFWRAALRLALPVALQNFLVSSFVLVDTAMVVRLGEIPLAAVGMAGQMSWLMNIVFFGFTSGASVFIAQYWGVQDLKGIYRTYGIALVSALSVSLLFMAVGRFLPQYVLACFTTDEAVIELGCEYLKVACLSYVAICLNSIFCTLLRSTENVKLPMYVSMVSVVANALLNALFMFGLKMGVRGAALATAISAWISPVLLFIISARRKNILFTPPRRLFDWGAGFVKKYYKTSLPVLFNESLWALGTVCFKMIYSHKSTEFYAAYTIAITVSDMIFVFFIGLCHACAVMIGKQVGAQDEHSAYVDSLRFTIAMCLLSVVLGSVMIALRGPALRCFGVTEETSAVASQLILIMGLWITVRNIPFVTVVGIFRAGGDTKIGLLLDCVCLWFVSLPVTWLCAYVFNLPLTLVFLCMYISEDLPKSIFCLRHLLSKKWIQPVTTPAEMR